MDPNIVSFLYINGAVVLVLVLYLAWRPKKNPSQLKLRQTFERNKPDVIRPKPDRHTEQFKHAPEHEVRKERVLNVIFQFNGHDFDAHEVLGITPGASIDKVENLYRELLSRTPKDEHEFYRRAFDSIKAARR